MRDPVTARAETVALLEQAAQSLKRHMNVTRRTLREVRQAQTALLGIQTTTQPDQGGHSATDRTEDRRAAA